MRPPLGVAAGRRPGGDRARASLLAVLLLSLSGACAPPDCPAAASAPLSGAAARLLAPDTVRTIRVAPGIGYRYVWSDAGPWAIHLLEVDLARCDVAVTVVRAPGHPGSEDARMRVSDLLSRTSAGAVAAVNGDFFTPDGRPRGPELSARGLRSPGARPVFVWAPGRGPWIGPARVVRDSLVETRGPTAASGQPGAEDVMVAGFPELLDDGRRVGDLEVEDRPSFAAVRHPRTAVGFAPEEGRLWLVVVDGRQAPRSVGMTLPEVADLLEALGAEEALNLDGGGSSTMTLGRRSVSRPSDEGGERPVANALVVRSDPSGCAGRAPTEPGGDERSLRPSPAAPR